MKDEFDDVTPDMFEGTTKKTVARPDMSARLKDIQATVDRGVPINKSDTAFLEKYGNVDNKVKKVARPDMSARDAAKAMASDAISKASGRGGAGGGGAGGGDLPPGFTPGKKGGKGFLDYKKGGKVSSASSRADGCAIKGKTKGRFV